MIEIIRGLMTFLARQLGKLLHGTGTFQQDRDQIFSKHAINIANRPFPAFTARSRCSVFLFHGLNESRLIAGMDAESRIAQLKLELPPAPKPVAVYKPTVLVGNLLYVSGHGPLKSDKTLICGRVGADLDLAAGKLAARQVGLAILATLRAELGSLNRVRRLVKVLGMVNCTPDFAEHPAVINGCSELFAEVFGPEHGIAARSAVGMGSLPGNIAVEIEAIFEIA